VRPITLRFDAATLQAARREVREFATGAGAPPQCRDNLILAASEAMANSVLHGGGEGVLRLWANDTSITGEIEDRGRISDPLAGHRRPSPTQPGGRGLWIINQVCDTVHIRDRANGQAIRFTVHT